MKHHYLECDCSSAEHTIRFTLDEDEVYPNIYVSVQLSPFRGFFWRLWNAVKYVFGYDCKWGHWDETLLTGPEVMRLKDLCEKHLVNWTEYMREWEEQKGSKE